MKLIDLTGQTFGKLTVINRADNHVRTSGRVDIMWNCKCDCGNLCTVRGERLRNGTTKSCGCYRTESLIANHKKYNDYDLSGEYGICYASNTGEEILFDLEDYDKIKDYCWYVQYTNKEKSYKRVQGTIKHGQYIKMHRLIIDCPNDCVVDHVNRNPLDNRKENLRVCSQTENMRNRKQNINNKLGIKGVYQIKNGSYCARIIKEDIAYHIGLFDTVKEAADAYDSKAKELFGEFAYLNNYTEGVDV